MEVLMIAHGRRAKSLWLALVLAPYSIRSPSGATREIRVRNQPKDSKTLGLTIPPSLFTTAGEVIE
jgi:hypothetical protein